MLRIRKLQLFLLISGLLGNFAIRAADAKMIKNSFELKAVIKSYKKGGAGEVCKFLGCTRLRLLNRKTAGPHCLAYHASAAFKAECSWQCDHADCDYRTLQKTNVVTHKIAEHGFVCPTRKTRPKKGGVMAVAAPVIAAPKPAKRAYRVAVVSAEIVAAPKGAKRVRVVEPQVVPDIMPVKIAVNIKGDTGIAKPKFLDTVTGKAVSLDW